MFSLPEMGVLGILALLLFGPEKLPGIMRQVGRVTREIQATSQTFVREMERAADLSEPPPGPPPPAAPPVEPVQDDPHLPLEFAEPEFPEFPAFEKPEAPPEPPEPGEPSPRA